MNLQPRKESIIVQNEFLRNSQDIQVKTAGVTLNAADFTGGDIVKAGTAIYVDSATKQGRKWQAATVATETGAGLTMHDVRIVAGQNPIVGVLVSGHPLESKCTGVTANFKTATQGRIVFDI